MKTERNIFYKSATIFFIWLVMFISIHILFEYHSDTTTHQEHYCVLCHQAMLKPALPVSIIESVTCIQKRIFPKAKIVSINQVRFIHLSVRGPPVIYHFYQTEYLINYENKTYKQYKLN